MTKLEKIVKEAQKMRKAHPKKYAKWTDYIKAASKMVSEPKAIKGVNTKYEVAFNDGSKISRKSFNDIDDAKRFAIKHSSYSTIWKKSARSENEIAKYREGKKIFGNSKNLSHKDTKSHNVNIKVVSGVRHDNVDVIIKKIANNKIKLAESRKAAKAEKDPYMKLLITAHRVNKYRDEIKLLQLELKQIQSKIRKSK